MIYIILNENDFYDCTVCQNDGELIVIGKCGRFTKNKYSTYKIRIKDDRITSETVLNHYNRLYDAKVELNRISVLISGLTLPK